MKLGWSDAQDQFPGGHLVTGYYDVDRLSRINQIDQLIPKMNPKGKWSTRTAVEKGERKIEILFELQEDAARLPDTLRAKRGSGVPGYGSAGWFEYTPQVLRKITSILSG